MNHSQPLDPQTESDTPIQEKPSLSLASSGPQHRPASSLKRLVALFIDGFASTLLITPVNFVFGMGYKLVVPTPEMTLMNGQPVDLTFTFLSMAVTLAATVIYYGFFMTRNGATPGKMVFNLKVLNAKTGQHLTWTQVILREIIGKFFSTVCFFMGYILAFFRKDKRTLHDFLCGSEVVQVEYSEGK